MLMGSAFIQSAGAADADYVRKARDRAEIEQLMWNYVRALDTFNSEAYVATYTEDGQFIAGGKPIKGHAALKKMIDDYRKDRAERTAKGEAVPPMNHVMTNEYLEFIDKDHARLHSYWMTVFGAAKDVQPRVAASGHGVDDLVRVNGRWLIQSRDVTPKD
jgi:hypothetical protein